MQINSLLCYRTCCQWQRWWQDNTLFSISFYLYDIAWDWVSLIDFHSQGKQFRIEEIREVEESTDIDFQGFQNLIVNRNFQMIHKYLRINERMYVSKSRCQIGMRHKTGYLNLIASFLHILRNNTNQPTNQILPSLNPIPPDHPMRNSPH